MRALTLLLLTLAFGFVTGWLFSNRAGSPRPFVKVGTDAFRCSMHPWIKTSHAGTCTLCGMAMTATTADSGPASSIRLGSNAVVTMGIRTAKVSRMDLARTMKVAGRIVEDETRRKRLSAYVSGRIEKLHINFEGAEVDRGQPLVTLYSPVLLEAEREYRLLYRQSQMNHSTKITAEHGRLLEAMNARLLQYGLTAEQIKNLHKKPDNSSFSEILSPIDGMVIKQSVVEGQYVDEGQGMLDMVDLYTMWFVFDVYESDLPMLETGLRIEIVLPDSDQPPVSGTISFINPNLNDVKRSAEARAELRNPVIRVQGRKTRRFHRQMYAEGRVQVVRKDLLAVPRSAVLDDGETARVWVESSPGVFDHRVVRIGFRGDYHWELAAGVVADERVAINGAALLDSQIKL